MSPTTSAVIINGVTPAPVTSSGPPPFVDVWAGKTALVTTLAGDTSGYVDNTGTNARFSAPFGVAVLPNGNIAVGDRDNNRIRLVTPAGVVTTLAGNGNGFLDNTGTLALFSQPQGVAALPNGNVVVGDGYGSNQRIRLITPEGVVTTLAGTGVIGSGDGPGATATFRQPWAVAVLPNGNIVVGDMDNSRIRLITMPSEVVSTIAGGIGGLVEGPGVDARFRGPAGVAALPNGDILVADSVNSRIRLITMSTGIVSTLAGSTEGFADGAGATAKFNYPYGIGVLPNGNIVVAEANGNRIRLITMPSRVVSTLVGNADSTAGDTNGIGSIARVRGPSGIAVLPNGNIIVCDQSNHRIRLITPI
jgi:glucose/arabinose dehydrogenase